MKLTDSLAVGTMSGAEILSLALICFFTGLIVGGLMEMLRRVLSGDR